MFTLTSRKKRPCLQPALSAKSAKAHRIIGFRSRCRKTGGSTPANIVRPLPRNARCVEVRDRAGTAAACVATARACWPSTPTSKNWISRSSGRGRSKPTNNATSRGSPTGSYSTRPSCWTWPANSTASAARAVARPAHNPICTSRRVRCGSHGAPVRWLGRRLGSRLQRSPRKTSAT